MRRDGERRTTGPDTERRLGEARRAEQKGSRGARRGATRDENKGHKGMDETRREEKGGKGEVRSGSELGRIRSRWWI